MAAPTVKDIDAIEVGAAHILDRLPFNEVVNGNQICLMRHPELETTDLDALGCIQDNRYPADGTVGKAGQLQT